MPVRKKILYFGLLLLLLLLALEGMARIAYFAAYGQWYGGGRADPPAAAAIPQDANQDPETWRIRHPFYGFTDSSASLLGNALNVTPPRQRRADTVVVGLLGGSLAAALEPYLQHALNRWFAANNRPQRPLVLRLASGGAKQPQQTMVLAHTLLLGGEFDLIVNLDGFNEVVFSAGWNPRDGVFPFFPTSWDKQVSLTRAEFLLAGRIAALRRKQARLTAAGETAPWRRSALFALTNRYRQERAANAIIQLNRQLAATTADYNLAKHGPRGWPAAAHQWPAAAALWYRSSRMLARLAALAQADYYHFLQPNQYVPAAKPLSPQEQANAYNAAGPTRTFVEQGYPLLRAFAGDLPKQGINYFDLTGIFAARPETLYSDDCCHLNARGYELLAAEITQRLAPALRRRAAAIQPGPVSPLAAARRPPALAAARPPAPLDFQVRLQDNHKTVQYVRENCDPEDAEPPFFLHLTPQDLTDLPPVHREIGFDNRIFNFYAAGGSWQRGQCALQVPLPDYPIAQLRTGQFLAGGGELWSTAFPFPQ